MSSSTTVNAAGAPNRCDVVPETTVNAKPMELTAFLSQRSAEEELRRTADYLKDSKAYLQKCLGSEKFSEREHLFSLPEQRDKDIYGNGGHMAYFVQHIAKLYGKDHGLFFVTGVQAQLAALRTHCDQAGNRRAAWHVTSHLEEAEAKSWDVLYGLDRRLVGSSKDANPSVDEIKEVLALPKEQQPAVILLEIPNRVLGCATYQYSELEQISSACKEAGVKFHCDGARFWEIEPYYRRTAGKSFAEVAALFDSIYVSFYKALRGVTGAMLLSNDKALMEEAKLWRRRAGGNPFTLYYEVIDCERGFNENIGSFDAKWKKMEEIVEGVNKSTTKYKTSNGNQVVVFIPEKPTCAQIRTGFQGYTEEELLAARGRVVKKKGVSVFSRLWPKKPLDDQTEEDMKKWMETGKMETENKDKPSEEDDRRHIIEWMILNQQLETDTKVFVDAYVALCEELQAGSQ